MSSGRLFLEELVATRAPLRFTGTIDLPCTSAWPLQTGHFDFALTRIVLAVDELHALGVDWLQPFMNAKDRYQNRIELLQGTLDMLILKTLQWGSQHGYGIIQAIRTGSSDVLQVETGSLYPALHRLERQGWLTAEWKQTESNQRAKYYRLTPSGKKQLASEQARWAQLSSAIGQIMGPQGELS
jgi:transcriptional regulator